MVSKRKLTNEEVREIRRSQASARELARRYGVTHPTILNVREGRTYSHVSDEAVVPELSEYWETHRPNADLAQYHVVGDVREFLARVPAGACETVLVSPPQHPEAHWHDTRWQWDIITECLRIAGLRGIVLYHHRLVGADGRLDTGSWATDGFPLQRIIIWNHGNGESIAGTGGRHAYDMIFAFTGKYWSLPEESEALVSAWGDVWDISANLETGPLASPFSPELADRCIAMGRGCVLDPFARSGTTGLAALNAGRPWLGNDTDLDCARLFVERRDLMERYSGLRS